MNPAGLSLDDLKHLEFHKQRWLEYLFRTEPSDRSAVQEIVSGLYQRIDFESPRHFLWYDSPLEAVWAAALLAEPHDWLLQNVLKSMLHLRASVAKIEQVRAGILKQTGASTWEAAIGEIGSMHTPATYVQSGGMAVHKDIAGGFFARIRDSVEDSRSPSPAYLTQLGFTVQEASALFFGPPYGELVAKQAERDGASLFGNIVSSSVTRAVPIVLLVPAETRAYLGGRDPASPKAGLWKMLQSCGWWWAFENAVVLADRPTETHRDDQGRAHNEFGAAISFRDGWGVYAWHGSLVAKELLLRPENADPKQIRKIADPTFRQFVLDRYGSERFEATSAKRTARGKASKILSTELPRERDQRIATLRKHTPQLPLFDRYLSGEREQVWAELVVLGAQVREDAYAADALAVASETMWRVASNTDRIIARLLAIGYEFRTEAAAAERMESNMERALAMEIPRSDRHKEMLGMVDKLRGMLGEALATSKSTPRNTSIRAHVAPVADTWKLLRRFEKTAGALPLSLRAFYEIVGSVDLLGFHRSLAPKLEQSAGAPCPDQLVVFPLEEVIQDLDAWKDDRDEDGGSFRVPIAPDELTKADTSGGSPYEIIIPCVDADVVLENERHSLPFVSYLRLCFEWGGFPGFEGYDLGLPPEIEELKKHLLPI
jgi:hypothetical protein